jgi:hypothetical protein
VLCSATCASTSCSQHAPHHWPAPALPAAAAPHGLDSGFEPDPVRYRLWHHPHPEAVRPSYSKSLLVPGCLSPPLVQVE